VHDVRHIFVISSDVAELLPKQRCISASFAERSEKNFLSFHITFNAPPNIWLNFYLPQWATEFWSRTSAAFTVQLHGHTRRISGLRSHQGLLSGTQTRYNHKTSWQTILFSA
jgi:hypothetical protein